jgi:hypothetical protein
VVQRAQHHVGHQMAEHVADRDRRGPARGEDGALGRGDLEGLERPALFGTSGAMVHFSAKQA